MTQESAPHFFDESDGQKLRIHTISTYLKQTFGKKMVKLSLDGGELHVDGRIDSVAYEEGGREQGGFLRRLFG